MKRLDKDTNIDILYFDNHLLIAEKPAGLLTQPTALMQDSLEKRAKDWLKKKLKKKANVYLHALHRLDKPVGGIVLFAKTSKALSRMQKLMREKKIVKIYIAEVEGNIEKDYQIIEHYLIRSKRKSEIVAESTEAKKAQLILKILKKKKNTTLLQVQLLTGRYHQIRSQLAHLQHPIVGDHKYGSKTEKEKIHLHHAKCSFLHPVLGKIIEVESKPKFF